MSIAPLAVGGAAPRPFYRHVAGFAFGVLLVLLLLGLLHSLLAPFAAGAAGAGPPLAAPSTLHPLGTDLLGRDLWSETIHGLGETVYGAIAGLVVVLLFGELAGLAAAHALRASGTVARLAANVLLSIPTLLLAILFSAFVGPDNAPLAAGLAVAPAAFARRFDRTRLLRDAPYSEFAWASGVPALALLRRDVAHELRESPVAAVGSLLAAVALTLSTISFFGFGTTPPERDLGLMIASARADLAQAWWPACAPGVTLMLFIVSARLAAGISRSEEP